MNTQSGLFPKVVFWRASGLVMALCLVSLVVSGTPSVQPQAVAARSVAPLLDELVVAIENDVVGLDPALLTDEVSLRVNSQVYDTLFEYQPGGVKIQPGLAQVITVSPDVRTWTLTLRSGVQFHDGSPLNAAAVVYNFQRWWDPAHPYHNGSFEYFVVFLGGYKGDPNCILSNVQAQGASQVVFTFSQPFSLLPEMLTNPAFSIASPTAIQAGNLDTQPVGSGPFEFTQWTPEASIELQANPQYWGQVPAYAHLTFEIITDPALRYQELDSGAAHLAYGLPESYVVLAEVNPDLQVLLRPATGLGYLGINRSHSPLDNLLVRQAIAHAIDKDGLIRAFYSSGDQVAGQFLPPIIAGFVPGLEDYAYDPPLAVALLAQAGYPGGLETAMAYRDVYRTYLPQPDQIAAAIANQLAQVGIQVTVTEFESGLFLQKYANGELDLFLLGWYADYLHPSNFFQPLLCNNYLAYGAQDQVLCNLAAHASSTDDGNVQLLDYAAATQRVYDSLPLVPLVNPVTPLVARAALQGLVPSPIGLEQLEFVTLPMSNIHLPLVVR